MPTAKRPAPILNLEIQAQDAAKSASFYRAVFGWSITRFAAPEKFGLPASFTIENASGRGILRGHIQERSEIFPRVNGFLCSVRVASLTRTAKAAVANGGTVVGEFRSVPEVGGYLFVVDPDGNVVMAVEMPKKRMAGKTTSNKRMQLTRSALANDRRGPRS